MNRLLPDLGSPCKFKLFVFSTEHNGCKKSCSLSAVYRHTAPDFQKMSG